jgi:hypothetical protein
MSELDIDGCRRKVARQKVYHLETNDATQLTGTIEPIEQLLKRKQGRILCTKVRMIGMA